MSINCIIVGPNWIVTGSVLRSPPGPVSIVYNGAADRKFAGKYDKPICFVRLLASGPCCNFFTNSWFVSWNLTAGATQPRSPGTQPACYRYQRTGVNYPLFIAIDSQFKMLPLDAFIKGCLHMEIVNTFVNTAPKYECKMLLIKEGSDNVWLIAQILACHSNVRLPGYLVTARGYEYRLA